MNRRIASGGGRPSARALAVAAAAVVVEALERRALMSAGALDPTFGSGGVVRLDTLEKLDVVTVAGAVQADGKAVIAGNGQLVDSDRCLTVARLTVAGEPDSSFGDGVVVELADPGFSAFTVKGVDVMADGRIVVAGTLASETTFKTYVAVTRLMPDGGVDASFGTQGWATVPFAATTDVRAMALGADGDVYVAGTDGQARPSFAVARLTAAGVLDDAFGRQGYEVIAFPGGGRVTAAVATAVVVGADGSALVAGGADRGRGKLGAVVRISRTGALDPTFGTGGGLTVPGVNPFSAVALRADGGAVLAGAAGRALEVTAGTPTGVLDATFGSGGAVGERVMAGRRGSSRAAAAAVDVTASGQVVVSGSVVGRQVSGPLVARFGADGSPDATFGDGGVSVFATRAAWDNRYAEPLVAGGLLLGADGSAVVPFDGAPNARVKRARPQLRAVRFAVDGGVDGSYGTAGVGGAVAMAQGPNSVFDVTPQADGSVVADADTGDEGYVVRTYAVDGSRGQDLPLGYLSALARDAQGRYLVGGGATLRRYALDGTPDATFGADGVATLDIPLFNSVRRIWPRADGSILVLGSYATDGLPEGSRLFAIDASGHVTATVAADIGYDINPGSLITDVAVTPEGKVLVAYNDYQDSNAEGTLVGAHVARFNADLTPDTSFGTNGVTELSGIPVGGSQYNGFGVPPRGITSIAVAPDGHVYAVVLPSSQGQSAVLVRLAPNGAIDNGFGTGGYRSDLPVLGSIFAESDGRLIGAAGVDGMVKLARYDVNGNLDATFGNAGVSTVTIVAGAQPQQSPVQFTLADVNGAAELYAAGEARLAARPSDAATGGAYEGFIARIDV